MIRSSHPDIEGRYEVMSTIILKLLVYFPILCLCRSLLLRQRRKITFSHCTELLETVSGHDGSWISDGQVQNRMHRKGHLKMTSVFSWSLALKPGIQARKEVPRSSHLVLPSGQWGSQAVSTWELPGDLEVGDLDKDMSIRRPVGQFQKTRLYLWLHSLRWADTWDPVTSLCCTLASCLPGSWGQVENLSHS